MSIDAAAVLARVATDAVAAQLELDELAVAAAERWQDTGMPPLPAAYSDLRLGLEMGLGLAPRTRAGEPCRLLVRGSRRPAKISVALALRSRDDA